MFTPQLWLSLARFRLRGRPIYRVANQDCMLGLAAVITLSTPLILGLVALLRGRPEDYPEILRALFRRSEKKRK